MFKPPFLLLPALGSGLMMAQAPETIQVWDVAATAFGLMPDIDGDGHPELLAGVSDFNLPGIDDAGRLQVVSSSGPIMFEHFGARNFDVFGENFAAVGDVNGDGFSDYMGSGVRNPALVFSGMDGSLLFTHVAPAQDAAALGDVDGDGFGDFLLGSANRAFFYQGGSFELRQLIVPPLGTAGFGEKTVPMGDIDGDGFVDFAVAAPGCGCFKFPPPGEVFVYSGRSGQVLYRLFEPLAGLFGQTLEAPGDLTGDGLVDLAVGAHACCSDDEQPGRLYFFDGKTGALLQFLEGRIAASQLALRMDSLGDLDGNGFADVLAWMLRIGGHSLLAVDGNTREIIHEYDFGNVTFAGGGHDWNGDGFPDFLLDLGFPPRIELRSGAPPGTAVLGQPCGTILGQSPRIGATGVPTLGRNYSLHLSDVPGDAPALLRISVLGITQKSPEVGLRGCTFLSETSARFRVTTQKIAPGRGAATVELPIPANPALQGLRFSAQWTVLDSRGRPLAHTRILRPTIGG